MKQIAVRINCPVCGQEMVEKMQDRSRVSVSWSWHCSGLRCNAASPSCTNRDVARRVAIDWARKE